ncbi:hypothetical protein POJ06DRAFT_47805 [Lipomyces tetrasporus]|uniref:VLRF1 domain-containing protein n=1 Tax=Lipomyces tetrasporus TaxID=54092 RepID=A0AAD7QJT8_9ASCO|nr:uncharacterized protein POJ06DRAFT_47805 [Lipomyces tetrasporus]KAJ8096507.1 hypothetical protein POJ06DRAFT_47805 [Lipomyces tetrasporus]
MTSSPSPFYVYALPESLLSSLVPISFDTTSSAPVTSEQQALPIQSSLTPSSDPPPQSSECTSKQCNTCNYNATSTEEQRDHYKSDYHKFNVKRKVLGLPAVGGPEFEVMLDELEESISGSDSSDSETDSPSDSTADKVSSLIAKTALATIQEEPDYDAVTVRSPYHLFQSSMLPPEEVFAIYSTLFPVPEDAAPLDVIRSRQLAPKIQAKAPSTPVSAIFMLGGGHFAGAIISHALSPHNKLDPVVFVEHKTFHRYTTRRKQGGSQSASDNAHGKAHSAGSNLRRYNEAALEKEVRELLAGWKPYLDRAEHIFVRANGRQNRGILVGYEGAVIGSRDKRVKGIPFSTRRATGSEVKRVWLELTRPKILKKEAFAPPKPKPKLKETGPVAPSKEPEPLKQLSPEELHTSQIVALVKKSRTNPLATYLKSNQLSPDFRFEPAEQYHHTPTALHLAASLSLARMVTFLLVALGASPTDRNDEGRTSWELSGDRATRDAFRLARAELGERKWNWAESGVSSALTKDDIAARDAREKASAERQRVEEVKKLERNGITANQNAATTGGRKLASSVVTSVGQDKQLLSGLTPEARMKIERERRARAVEVRLRAQQQKQ